jgi:hypothetical protein
MPLILAPRASRVYEEMTTGVCTKLRLSLGKNAQSVMASLAVGQWFESTGAQVEMVGLSEDATRRRFDRVSAATT